MSSNRLPLTDLANIATLPLTERRGRLEMKRNFVPPHSLNWTRRNLAMLFGVRDPMFLDHPRPSRMEILRNFADCLPKGPGKATQHRRANLLRAEALLDFTESNVESCVQAEYSGFEISAGYSVSPAESFGLVINERRVIPSVDLRASGALTERGLSFYFALNHHMILEREPDLDGVGLALLDFYHVKDDYGIRVVHWDGAVSYTYEEIDEAVRVTLKIWDEVVESRRQKKTNNDEGSDDLFGRRSA